MWWSRAQDARQQLSSWLLQSHAEISSMQRLWQIPIDELSFQGDIAVGSFGRVV
jgi:hypothetical protein